MVEIVEFCWPVKFRVQLGGTASYWKKGRATWFSFGKYPSTVEPLRKDRPFCSDLFFFFRSLFSYFHVHQTQPRTVNQLCLHTSTCTEHNLGLWISWFTVLGCVRCTWKYEDKDLKKKRGLPVPDFLATKTLACAFVLSRLDCCNLLTTVILFCLAAHFTFSQNVQKPAAKLVSKHANVIMCNLFLSSSLVTSFTQNSLQTVNCLSQLLLWLIQPISHTLLCAPLPDSFVLL